MLVCCYVYHVYFLFNFVIVIVVIVVVKWGPKVCVNQVCVICAYFTSNHTWLPRL
jgi:hypothetical protein